MARVGRPVTVLDGVDEDRRGRIVEAVVSAANEKPTAIYRRFGLEQAGVNQGSFLRWCKRIRREHRRREQEDGRVMSPPPATVGGDIKPRAMTTLLNTLAVVQERLDAGDAKSMVGLSMTIKALLACAKVSLDEEANQRAEEKQAAWREERQRQQQAALDEMAGRTPGLTPELLAQIKSRVLGI